MLLCYEYIYKYSRVVHIDCCEVQSDRKISGCMWVAIDINSRESSSACVTPSVYALQKGRQMWIMIFRSILDSGFSHCNRAHAIAIDLRGSISEYRASSAFAGSRYADIGCDFYPLAIIRLARIL